MFSKLLAKLSRKNHIQNVTPVNTKTLKIVSDETWTEEDQKKWDSMFKLKGVDGKEYDLRDFDEFCKFMDNPDNVIVFE